MRPGNAHRPNALLLDSGCELVDLLCIRHEPAGEEVLELRARKPGLREREAVVIRHGHDLVGHHVASGVVESGCHRRFAGAPFRPTTATVESPRRSATTGA